MLKKLDQRHTHRSFAMPVMLYDIAKAKVKALKYKKNSKHEADVVLSLRKASRKI